MHSVCRTAMLHNKNKNRKMVNAIKGWDIRYMTQEGGKVGGKGK
jgi:hypothetical protein